MDNNAANDGDAPFTQVRITVKQNIKFAEYFAPTSSDLQSLFIPITDLEARLNALREMGERAPLTERAILELDKSGETEAQEIEAANI